MVPFLCFPLYGLMVAAALVKEEDGIMLISNKGTMIRTNVSQVPTLSRNTQGVRIIKLSGEEKVVSAIKIDDNLI